MSGEPTIPQNTPKTPFPTWLGHIGTLLAAGAGVGAGYGTIDNRIIAVERRLESLEDSLEPLIVGLREDVKDVQVRIAEMNSDMRWLKDTIKK